jgi:hypothetical protein
LLTYIHEHTHAIRDGAISLFTGHSVAFLISDGPTWATLAKGAGFSIVTGITIKSFEEFVLKPLQEWRKGRREAKK